MVEVLQGLAIAAVVGWGLCLVVALRARHHLRRGLRIDPAVRSTVPTAWLLAPTTGPRWHRRVRRAAATARAAAVLDPSLAPLAEGLVQEAVALEPSLVLLARTGRTPGPLRRDLAGQVADLEGAAHRLAAMADERRPTGPSQVRARVEAVAAARQELTELERRAGLTRPA